MAFKDIKGQERAIEFFRSCLTKHRFAHAYLFLGPEGVGKTLLAQNLAKFLNCDQPEQDQYLLLDCCDQCLSCRKVTSGNHPDVHWVKRAAEAKEISIEEIRTMQRELALKAYEGRFKIFIIRNAHEMSEEAAHCLLKTLEEPPGFSLIILTATNLRELLPTIVSRTQVIRFYLLNQTRLNEILIKDYHVEPGYARFLSGASEGRLARALLLKEKDALNEKNRLIEQACGLRLRPSAADIFNIKDRQELSVQIRYILNWFRDILLVKAGVSGAEVINVDRWEKIKSAAGTYTFEELEQTIAGINQAYRLIEQNVNPKIALEVMLLSIARNECNQQPSE